MRLIEGIKIKIMQKKKEIRDRDYRYMAIPSETLPLYHDRFRSTNKNKIMLEKNDERVGKMLLESQDDNLIEFHKDFNDNPVKTKHPIKLHDGNPEFTKEGMKQGDIYKVLGQGFLENQNSTYEVALVTNNYVFMKDLLSNNIYPYSYKEINRMKGYNAIEQV